jgi:hypothetical protein
MVFLLAKDLCSLLDLTLGRSALPQSRTTILIACRRYIDDLRLYQRIEILELLLNDAKHMSLSASIRTDNSNNLIGALDEIPYYILKLVVSGSKWWESGLL